MRPDVSHFLRPRGRLGPAEDIPARLRELATETTPPYDWEEFRRRGHERAARKGRHVQWWPHAAAAAGVAGVVAAMALLGNGGNADSPPLVAEVERNARSGAEVQTMPMQDWLARQPAEPVVVSVASRIAVTNLEDRIAWFDDVLMNERLDGTDTKQVEVLQQERARLVKTLAQVRYAEALVAGGS
jgi:hypothetical protein